MRNGDYERLRMIIDTASFAVDDIKLYLDTHPTDRRALEYYEHYRNIRLSAIDDYTMRFGPLTADQVMASDRWTWIEKPWPWEGEYN